MGGGVLSGAWGTTHRAGGQDRIQDMHTPCSRLNRAPCGPPSPRHLSHNPHAYLAPVPRQRLQVCQELHRIQATLVPARHMLAVHADGCRRRATATHRAGACAPPGLIRSTHPWARPIWPCLIRLRSRHGQRTAAPLRSRCCHVARWLCLHVHWPGGIASFLTTALQPREDAAPERPDHTQRLVLPPPLQPYSPWHGTQRVAAVCGCRIRGGSRCRARGATHSPCHRFQRRRRRRKLGRDAPRLAQPAKRGKRE